MRKLTEQVVQWAQDKGLLTDVTNDRIQKQRLKILEEIGETSGAYLKGNQDELVDGIGDIAVTIILAHRMTHNYAMKFSPENNSELYREPSLFRLVELVSSMSYYQAMEELYLFALSQNYDLEDCLQSAYDVISKRTGKMVNGTFIKDK